MSDIEQKVAGTTHASIHGLVCMHVHRREIRQKCRLRQESECYCEGQKRNKKLMRNVSNSEDVF